MTHIRFESRDLNDYAEPVDPSSLETGKTYFLLHYADAQLLIPFMEPLLFVGRNMTPGDSDKLYFQRYPELQEVSEEETGLAERAELVVALYPVDLGAIFTFEKALEQLLKCSIRRDKIEKH